MTVPWTQRGSATTTVVPTAGVLPGQNLKSWANWRAFLYSMAPIALTALTAIQLQFNDRVSAWMLLAVSVVTPLLSVANTADKLRQAVYAALGLLSTAGFVANLLVGHEAWIPIVSSVVAILSSTMAGYYVPRTTMQSANTEVATP